MSTTLNDSIWNGSPSADPAGFVQIPLWEEGTQGPDGISAPSICFQMQGIHVEIHEHARADVVAILYLPCTSSARGIVRRGEIFPGDRLYGYAQ